ncbi:MAG TPA: 3-oxoacyl-[acyl-carrier-protein] synthase III C-terminal domain-containing protein [Chloroflexia bacterium]|jgi:3-oxoacyl-[acyl-carrier-protein] synthase III
MRNSVIESLGVYLPEKAATTEEVLQGCKIKINFPLEKLTGIRSRRIAARDEFSRHLAEKAITNCFANSRYAPADIDLIISCSISRGEGPEHISVEPTSSVKLRDHFGFSHAAALDITNACAGIFTAIYIIESCIKAGSIRRGMVISGEHITPLMDNAQKEIVSEMDPRLACLTLGDAGVALILEEAPNDAVGFNKMDIYTVGCYSTYCIAKATEHPHGGAIMLTDSPRLSMAAIQQSSAHLAHIYEQQGRSIDSMSHLIMHQASEKSLRDGMRELNRLFNKEVCHDGNVIINLAERGNTATTTHFVALYDYIMSNAIQSGDEVVFSVNASGLTVGTALYTFDDLPDRLRGTRSSNGRHSQSPSPSTSHSNTNSAVILYPQGPRVRIESVGTIPDWSLPELETLDLVKSAAEDCLERSTHDRNDVDLLIFAGMYRTDYIAEPAIAALVAGKLAINDIMESQTGRKTLAFDVFNGAAGFLTACYVAIQMIQAETFKCAMIVASEVELNRGIPGKRLLGLKEIGSAVVLDESGSASVGFGPLAFRYFPEHMEAYTVHAASDHGVPFLESFKDPALEQLYIDCIEATVQELLASAGLTMQEIKLVVPPQISISFTSNLGKRLGVGRDKVVSVTRDGEDFYTSSLPYALKHAREQFLIDAGDIGLLISVSAGLQVACALYYF